MREMPVRKLTLSLAVMAALLPSHVLPLGLGEIELNSALNQELNAEIEVLSAAPEDAEQLIVKLASREAFARAGIDRPFSLQDLKFKTILKGNKPYIQVYTTESVREPYLSFLVEIDWPNGHLLREYTLLLDPPVFNSPAENAATSSMEQGGSGQDFFEPAGASAEPAATDEFFAANAEAADAGYEPAPATQSFNMAPEATADNQNLATDQPAELQEYRPAPQYNQQVSGQYRVQEHDTLWSLANKLRPNENVSVEQMMLALVQENPESFIKENVNGLKRGYILRMPEPANITAIDRQTALEQVRQHNALWREYRHSMSASVPASAMESDETAADANAAESTDGRLSIVSAGGQEASEASLAGQDPKSQVKQLKRELSLARETLESERLEKENLRGRLDELEQRVQHVFEMDDAELAKLQADLASTKKQAEKIAVPVVPAVPETSGIAPPESTPEQTAETTASTTPGEPPLFVDETQAVPSESTDTTAAAETETQMAEEAPAPAPAKPAPAVPQPAGWLDNPFNLAILGGAGVLIAALVAMMVRRRRAAKAEDNNKWADMDQPINFDDAVEAVGEPFVRNLDDTANDMPTVKTAAPSMEDTVISLPDEAAPAEETEQRDDVLAEADVYLAYGIYQQAEELLRTALKEHPERDDYRMKLLETHYASKNASAFADLAKTAKERKGSVKSYWDRVLVMGRELCPDNAMFGVNADLLPTFDAGDLLPQKPQTTDLELDVGGATPDLDLDLGFTEARAPAAEPDFALDADSTMIMQQPVAEAMPEFDLAADLENIANAMDRSSAAAPAKDNLSADLDLGDLDFTADALELETETSETGGIDEDFALDFEASDLGLATDDAAAEVSGMDTSLDLAMDMDELSMDAGVSNAVALDTDMGGADDDFDISQLSDDIDEVSTKLDLARAYMDMGDNEGARNILEEVRSEGNEAQKKQAEDLLAKAS
jgi:pilus assembly protein FimV